MELIYLDNAATTRTDERVVEAMLPYFTRYYGNASTIYALGEESRKAVTRARDIIAAGIGAKPEEIYFTAGGSESDNWALKATAEAYKEKGKHIITSKIEHHAILHTCEWLERQGFEVTYLDVDENGRINPADVEAAIDMLSSSGHKLNGPKGIGFLYIRKGVKIRSFVHGGAQERKRRAGTENVPGIVGFGKAAELAFASMEERTARERELRDYMISRFEKEIPYVKINGDREHRLANNVNACFRFVEGESMLIMLDMKGICASSGSACTSGSLDPSHVLLAIGLPHEIAHGSLRLTLGADTTKEQIDTTVDAIKEIVAHLRSMSPLYEDFVKNQQ